MTFRFADAVFWLAVACCTVGHLAILRSVVVTPVGATDGRSASRRRALEIFWAVLPAIALAGVLTFTWRAMHTHVHVTHGPPASVASLTQ
jgi:heme/copper-type cytochrome/quinol oxidase subunit 2